jgi:toxin ParE1/3/4
LIVEWLRKASEDRESLFDYIAEHNPAAALSLDDQIQRQTLALPDNPELYRAGRVRGTREMILTDNVIVVYRIRPRLKIIQIVRIIGARQNYPKKRGEAEAATH